MWGAMLCHLQELNYDLQFLGTSQYENENNEIETSAIILVDNQATIRMSKNFKVTSKNRHIARRWHFVRRGVKDKLFILQWIQGKDQIADNCTKSQVASKSFPHFSRTLLKIPDKVKGFRGSVIGNR